MRTVILKRTVASYAGRADLDNAGHLVPVSSPSFMAMCTKESNIKVEGTVGATAFSGDYLRNINIKFYIEKSWNSRNEEVSFTVANSPVFVISSNATSKPKEGTWLDWVTYVKFSKPRTYIKRYARGSYVLSLNDNFDPYSVDYFTY